MQENVPVYGNTKQIYNFGIREDPALSWEK